MKAVQLDPEARCPSARAFSRALELGATGDLVSSSDVAEWIATFDESPEHSSEHLEVTEAIEPGTVPLGTAEIEIVSRPRSRSRRPPLQWREQRVLTPPFITSFRRDPGAGPPAEVYANGQTYSGNQPISLPVGTQHLIVRPQGSVGKAENILVKVEEDAMSIVPVTIVDERE